MKPFSERYGHSPARETFQVSDIDDPTRNAIWNQTYSHFETINYSNPNLAFQFCKNIWANYFHYSIDTLRNQSDLLVHVKSSIYSDDYYKVFNLIEFWISTISLTQSPHACEKFSIAINFVFEKHLVGYRVLDNLIVPVHDEIAIQSIDNAINITSKFSGAQNSLKKSLVLLSNRDEPDYENSIKESVSAVEAIVREMTGSKTLSAGLKKFEDKGLEIHPSLKEAWVKLYGWVSDEDGIRHGSIDLANADQALAKFVLLSSSAFIEYLMDESRKASNS